MAELSTCCDGLRWLGVTDICDSCREHADFYDEADFFNEGEEDELRSDAENETD